MEDLLVYQNELLENLRKAEINYKKSPKDRIKRPYLETRLEQSEKLWQEFKEGHKSIILKATETDRKRTYFQEDTFEIFEELYISYKSTLKEALQPFLVGSSFQPSSSASSVADVQDFKNRGIKLPTIKLPTFTGKYEEWQPFYDLFCTLIHDNEYLSPVQKLHYLKSNLSGEPEILLSNFSMTDANYDEAWNQLIKRYNNKRYNCNAILKTLFTQKAIPSESATLIKQLVDTTSTCLKALKNIGVNTDTWDMIVNYLVVSKLEPESIKLWEQQISTSNNDLPTWSELRDFLEARFRTLEMIESTKTKTVQPKSVAKPKVFHSNVTSSNEKKFEKKCALCSGDHYIFSCKKFGDKSTKERQEFVQTNKLCFNCLAPTHPVSKCRQSTCCKKCGRRHHSLLHFEKEQKIERPSESETSPTGIANELSTACTASVLRDPVQGYKDGDRYFYFPGDGDDTMHLVDAEEPADLAFIEEYTRNKANNEYWLYTRANPNSAQVLELGNAESVTNSNINFSKITVFLAHGWNGNGLNSMSRMLVEVFLQTGDVNVIVLNWSALASSSYTTAKGGTAEVGRGLGQFVNWLAGLGLSYNRVHLIGFCLGGHLVGNAGRETGSRVQRITALDPAGPLWDSDPNRIMPTDARYVEVIHTETTRLGYSGLCGDADFYPNGGSNMPGCWTTDCSHSRSYEYMTSSLKYNHLRAHECGSLSDAIHNKCTGTPLNPMGNSDINKSRAGIFRVNTGSNYPF